MATTLAGKTVLVVGGTSGIGYGVAEAVVAQGGHVIVASSTQSKVDSAVQRLQKIGAKGVKVSGATVNAREEQSIKALAESVGEVDHLVWTCGDLEMIGIQFPNIDAAAAKGAFEVRFWGPIYAAKYAKIKADGSIVLTTGNAASKPPKAWSVPAGVCGSVESLARGLAVELAPIRVNAVAPGSVLTEMWDTLLPADIKDTVLKGVAEQSLAKRVGTPQDMAEAYVFLMKCGFITGNTIHVDGGALLV
ncbi:short-chain dehydrogenase/reductase SDR [Exidia glandulosa HHB12029]|uniref:Short-chain dehydrogenase/reductase SDR n=1 Tax=Exidia glandulosa HHB12029 TaxID=1314781 RepID=A0A166BEY1_EXIGL|nr:short-chain dehydrogenase/reductase SDR [Exidia glandulosa HHB12029]